MQYLYADDMYHFMNTETYDQIDMTADQVGDSLKFVKENEMVKMLSHNGEVFAIEPPLFVELEITETDFFLPTENSEENLLPDLKCRSLSMMSL